MQYENRQPPEGINVVEHGWKRDFVLLVVGFFAALGLTLWLLLQLVSWTAKWMPFSWEKALVGNWFAYDSSAQQQVYLQQLANVLAKAGGLAPGLEIVVHFSPEPAINALATLAGNVVVFRGLSETVESEQGLAFVLAHEIAHVQHRHPAQAVARGLSLSVVSALVLGQTDMAQIAGIGSNLALLNYSREQESEADAWALQALYNHYGHVQGADELFRKLLAEAQSGQTSPEWLATHPDLRQRINRLELLARERGYAREGPLVVLPHLSEPQVPPANSRPESIPPDPSD